ncbi:MAG: SUMF1/EgtB/PvdO family nonheme iron enzyme [Anaerolineales bacterium]|nr:SUMF1/EgtB/PvdO family nonheme iron enzyme [Anaerolineales bacterium]
MRVDNYSVCVFAAVFSAITGCSSSSQYPAEGAVKSLLANTERDLVFVEGGRFWLGDVGDEFGRPFVPIMENNKPTIKVELDNFSILSKEVSWGEFLVFLQDEGRADEYTVKNGFRNAVRLPIKTSDDPASPNYEHKPARSPNYWEAENYCAWLAEKTGHPFALPTEAQWEYAARNRGRAIAYATDTGELEPDKYLQRRPIDPMQEVSGNVLIHSSSRVERRPVGSYPPNPLGLHDMTGNVPEWTRDWFQPGYNHLSSTNPVAEEPDEANPLTKSVRDLAGYGDHTGGLATVYGRRAVNVNSPNQGFRCVVNHPEPINS